MGIRISEGPVDRRPLGRETLRELFLCLLHDIKGEKKKEVRQTDRSEARDISLDIETRHGLSAFVNKIPRPFFAERRRRSPHNAISRRYVLRHNE